MKIDDCCAATRTEPGLHVQSQNKTEVPQGAVPLFCFFAFLFRRSHKARLLEIIDSIFITLVYICMSHGFTVMTSSIAAIFSGLGGRLPSSMQAEAPKATALASALG